MAKTVFLGGLGVKTVAVKGGTKSATFAVPSSFGVAAGDTVEQAIGITIGTNGVITTTIDLTSGFASKAPAANQLDNSAGVNTTGLLLLVTLTDIDAGV